MATKLAADTAFHPGEYLQEENTERGMSQRELARQLGRPYQSVNGIVKGRKAITAETALDLERVLGGDAETWLNLQMMYDLTTARQRRAAS
ncbi:MAG: HigA family addiction module antitoxin [Dehalococcoidia bacterium]